MSAAREDFFRTTTGIAGLLIGPIFLGPMEETPCMCVYICIYIYIYPVGITPGPPNQRNNVNSWSTFDDESSFSHYKHRGFRELTLVFFVVFFFVIFVFWSDFQGLIPNPHSVWWHFDFWQFISGPPILGLFWGRVLGWFLTVVVVVVVVVVLLLCCRCFVVLLSLLLLLLLFVVIIVA